MGPELAERGACPETDGPWQLNIHQPEYINSIKSICIFIPLKPGYIQDIITNPKLQEPIQYQKQPFNQDFTDVRRISQKLIRHYHHPRLHVAYAWADVRPPRPLVQKGS